MKSSVSKWHRRSLIVGTGMSVLLSAFAAYGVTTYRVSANVNQNSIEIGLAEVSPRGDAGGYAVPASGESVTITASPSTVASGGASTLTYSLSNPQGHGLGAFGCTIYDNEYNYYGGFGGAGPSGSISTGPLTQTKVFNYACNVEDYDPNTWFGANAVNSTTVTVSAAVNGACGSVNNSCNAGYWEDVADSSTEVLWNCVGSNGGSTASCSTPKTNGVCGAATNTCTAGTFYDSADTSAESRWACLGVNGGTTASCSTPLASCTLDGVTVASGDSRIFYSQNSGACGPSTQQSRTCTNGVLSGSATYQYASCTAAVPEIDFTASSSAGQYTAPATFVVEPNEPVTLTWDSPNATECALSFSDSAGTSGTATNVVAPPPGVTRTYTVTCTGPGGQSSASFTITTRERRPTLTASSLRVTSGGTVRLTYQLNANTSCTFDGPAQIDGRIVMANGTTEAIPVTAQTTFTLQCPGGASSVTINIDGSVQER